jgi:hypothetical protein
MQIKQKRGITFDPATALAIHITVTDSLTPTVIIN